MGCTRSTTVALTFAAALLLATAAHADDCTRVVAYRLMTYNVGSAANLPLGPRQIGEIAETIIDNAVDIAGLTEVELGTAWHDGRDHLSELAVALAGRGYPMHLYKWPAFQLQGGWQTPGILSRFPIEESGYEVVPPPGGFRWCVGHVTVNLAQDTPVRAYMTHFWPQGDSKACAEAVRKLAAVPNSFAGPRTIMGDFNLTPDSNLYQIVREQGWRNSCEVVHGSRCPSVQGMAGVAGPLPLTNQIDYIFGGEAIEFADTYVGYYSTSDHWPVFAEVRVKVNGPPVDVGLPDTSATRSASARARARAAVLYRKHEYRPAAAAYRGWEEVCDNDDDAGFAAYSVASMLLLDKDDAGAMNTFRRVLHDYPETEWSTRALYRIAFMHKAAGRQAEVEPVLVAYLDGYYKHIHPGDPKVPAVWITAQEIAASRSAAGNQTSAAQVLEDLRKRQPEGMVARAAAYRIARDKFSAGDAAGALPYLEQASPPARGMWPDEAKAIAEMYAAGGRDELAERFHDCYLAWFQDPLHRRVRAARWDRQRHPERYLVHVPAVSGISIDGDLSDWQVKPVVRLEGAPHVCVIDTSLPQQEMTASVHLGVSDDALLVAVDLTDRLHENPYAGRDIFKGDCVQMTIDPAADATKAYNADDLELCVALTKNGVESVVYYDQIKRDLSKLRAAVRHADGHTYYEVSIPFSALQVQGKRPEKIGFNILVGYGCGSERLGWLDWTPGIGEEKSPMLYPTLILRP